jgi:hypothetical protein
LRSGADRGEIESARPDPTELQGVLPGVVDDAVDDVSRPERQRVAAAGELDRRAAHHHKNKLLALGEEDSREAH